MIKRNLRILLSDRFMDQKINYLKQLFLKKRPVLGYKPVTVSIVSTTKCTLSCSMCPTHSNAVPKDYKWRQTSAKDMGFELFKRTLDLFHEALSVHIIGAGEPMLNKDFFRMVDYASRVRKMEVKTFSNGTTIAGNIENLLGSNLSGITVSLNAHNGEEFSRITGMPGGIYDKIYADTGRLIKERNAKNRNLKVNLSFVIDRENYRFIPEMIGTAERLGADHTFLCNFLPCPYGELTPSRKVITKRDTPIIQFIRKTKNDLPSGARERVSFPRAIDSGMKENKCDMHFNQVRVDGDENVSSCSMMLLNMENTGRIESKDPWNSTFLVNTRAKFLENNGLDELCLYCPSNKGREV